MKFRLIFSMFAVGLGVAACSGHRKSYSDASRYDDPNNPILFAEELEARQREESPSHDIPIVRNAKVETWINYFQGKGSKWFRLWLERSGKYIPFMRKILREHGLPEDLVYLAMIESGFSSRAYSRARAVGHWQFMRSTGRRYGLRVTYWVDERRDPEKATIAAARHLKDLFDEFQDWKLAAAAYNAGAGRVSRAMRRYKTEDFWELTKKRHLAAETRNYVPKLIAAAIIARDPEKYGFTNVQYQEPLTFEKVVVRKPVNLRKLAEATDMEFQDLWYLNPELNHAITPPDANVYELRVPSKSSEKFMAAIDAMAPEDLTYATHRVRRGETISGIARRYGVPQHEVMSLNQIRNSRALRVGRELILPIPKGVAKVQRRSLTDQRSVPKPRLVLQKDTSYYVVRRGDSLWSISRELGVSVRAIKEQNGLRGNQIRVGQRLAVPGVTEAKKATASPRKQVHIVRRGETLTAIAERYGTTVHAIKDANGLRRTTIYPGNRLHIPTI